MGEKKKKVKSVNMKVWTSLIGSGSFVVAGKFKAWHDVHGLQFLEEQLAGIGDA